VRCLIILLFLLCSVRTASADFITYPFFSSLSYTRSGVTVDVSNSGGALSASGWLSLGGVPGLGVYTFQFSKPVDYIYFRLLFFTDQGTPRQTMFDFEGDGAPVSLTISNSSGLSYDGTFLTPFAAGVIPNGNLEFRAAPGESFSTFRFKHTASTQDSFILRDMAINTAPDPPPPSPEVPEPGTALVLASGLGALAALKLRRA
jgi:hypothetical protein